MNPFTLPTICCFVLLVGAQFTDFNCNKNIPKKYQQLLLREINHRREPIPYIQNLPNLVRFDVILATTKEFDCLLR
ncbi:hypothetical protein TELCIR_02904 [Teladorsagia circumcincta]|uniref:Uncharacterized protein n=1 Tax=Teladorsagia circumcincta TaxID=45464 RepID=A0A2G9UZY8_TELCI|nr:hypothetical protein TELCIR_02904 [Teladorsagia circumcincta]